MFFKSFFIDLLYDILGGLAYGIGIVCFFNSCNIAPGGISGISIMLNYLFDTPIGIVSLLLNIPILIAGYLRLDKSVMNKTLKSILVTTIIMDYIVTPFFPVYSSDRILAALFGGIILGCGGLVRAYTHSAKIGIDAAEIITLSKWTVCEIQCEYTFYGKLETFIRDFGGVIENSDFGENVTLRFRIKKGLEESFDKKLQDLSNGKVSFSQIGEVIAGK